jgi:hypothetical protein
MTVKADGSYIYRSDVKGLTLVEKKSSQRFEVYRIYQEINYNLHVIYYKYSLMNVVPLLHSAAKGSRKIEHGC